jgi:hypothetical protein
MEVFFTLLKKREGKFYSLIYGKIIPHWQANKREHLLKEKHFLSFKSIFLCALCASAVKNGSGLRADLADVLYQMDTVLPEGFHFLGGSALAAGYNSPGMAHALARRGGAAGNVADNRLGEGFFLVISH